MASEHNVMDMFRLDGRVAMVTGGAQNLGLDMARALGEAGADLAITSRDLAKAEGRAAELREELGRRVLPIQLDATDPAAVDAAFDRAMAEYGRLDVLVNNCGGGTGTEDFEDRPRERFDHCVNINLNATYFCSQRAVRVMKQQRSGSIVNIASISGMVGRDRWVYEGSPDMVPNSVDYTTVKAGVIGMTKDLAAYVGKWNIRVNSISPGGFERGQPEEFIRRYNKQTILGRMGKDGRDLKGAVVLLASDAGDYITGQNLPVDGGFTTW